MAIREYRLPGVYSEELNAHRAGNFSGGYATVAFVGPAMGYLAASQTGVFGGGAINIEGSILESVPIEVWQNKRGGNEFAGSAFDVETIYDEDDVNKIIGISVTQSKVDIGWDRMDVLDAVPGEEESMTVTGKSIMFDEANPSFCIHTDENGNVRPGYVVAGTLVITDEAGNEFVYKKDATPDPDTGVVRWDYEVDWRQNVVTAAAGTHFESGKSLLVSYTWTYAEPVKLSGTSPYKLIHEYISPKSHCAGTEVSDDGTDVKKYVTAEIRSCVYKDEDGRVHPWGLSPNARWIVDEELDAGGFWRDDDRPVEVSYNDNGGAVTGSGDFVIDYESNTIARSSSTEKIPTWDDSYENWCYVSFGYCQIKDDEKVVINYGTVPENYFQPTFCREWNTCAALFGNGWNADGSVLSELSACTWLATRNGLRSFYACAVEPTVVKDENGNDVVMYPAANWDAAFDRLTQIEGIDIVVPLSGDTAVHSAVIRHLEAAYDNDDERMAFLGFDGTGAGGILDDDTMISRARTIARNDVVLVAPSTFRFRNPVNDIGGYQIIPGYWCTGALAGYLNNVPQYTSLTRKIVNGIFSSNEYRTRNAKRDLAAAGLCYVDEYNDGIRVVHGKTTSTASVIDQEANITLTKYYIIKNMRRMYETGYIGEPLTDNLIAAIRTAVTTALVNLSAQDYIYDFGNVTVTQNADDPTQVDIMFDYKPTYTLNYIVIQFTLNSSSGVDGVAMV